MNQLLFLLVYPSFCKATTTSVYTWVEARNSDTGHVETCTSAGLKATDESTEILWDLHALEAAALSLGKNVSKAHYGIQGCCSAGLWCNQSTCFTQGFGVFSNHGRLPGSSTVPVYSCYNDTDGVPGGGPLLLSADVFDGRVTIIGDGIGYNQDNTEFSVDGISCYSVESCSQLCRSCSKSSTCGDGSVCLSVQGSSGKCFQHCSGLSDLSCPCGSKCNGFSLDYSDTGSIPLFVCSYGAIEDGGCTDVSSTVQEFRCDAPQLQYSKSEDVTVSVIKNSESSFNNLMLSVPKQCNTSADCFDNNVCTIERCDNSTFTCLYSIIENCGSMPYRVREHQYSNVYDIVSQSGMSDLQSAFSQNLKFSGTRSSISDVDDVPHEIVELDFNFTYFGSIYSRVSLSPNGIISLPPFQECEIESYGTLDCLYYKSDTNSLSLWYADWNMASSADSGVYYLAQATTDGAIYGIGNVNAFHVLFDTAYRFRYSNQVLENPNSFSASLYEDGSMRFRYHDLNTGFQNSDRFGIWGSRSSSTDKSNLYYHQEPISSDLISKGMDFIFCNSAVLACPVKSCVIEGSYLDLYWGGENGCTALGSDVRRNYVCAWAGGIETTIGVTGLVDGRPIMSCPVPMLLFDDGELISVEITSSFAAVSVEDNIIFNISKISGGVSAKKNIYAISDMNSLLKLNYGGVGELTKHSLMVRYYSLGSILFDSEVDVCGCSPLWDEALSQKSICDSCGICRSEGSTVHPNSVDCSGECFGRAYVDDCNHCTAGSTNIEPDNTCNQTISDNKRKDFDEDLTGQLIFIVLVVCFMSCIFSICVYFSRTAFVNDQDAIGLDFIFVEQGPIQGLQLQQQRSSSRGLSAFERDALGTITYSQSLFKTNDSECAICLLSLQPGEICRVLPEPCGHCFHIDCVDKWFEVSPACPLCKRSIKKILLGEPEELSPLEFTNFDTSAGTVFLPSDDSADSNSSLHSAASAIELIVSSSSSRNRDGAYDRV